MTTLLDPALSLQVDFGEALQSQLGMEHHVGNCLEDAGDSAAGDGV